MIENLVLVVSMIFVFISGIVAERIILKSQRKYLKKKAKERRKRIQTRYPI